MRQKNPHDGIRIHLEDLSWSCCYNCLLQTVYPRGLCHCCARRCLLFCKWAALLYHCLLDQLYIYHTLKNGLRNDLPLCELIRSIAHHIFHIFWLFFLGQDSLIASGPCAALLCHMWQLTTLQKIMIHKLRAVHGSQTLTWSCAAVIYVAPFPH